MTENLKIGVSVHIANSSGFVAQKSRPETNLPTTLPVGETGGAGEGCGRGRPGASDPAAAGDMLGSIDKNTLTAWTSSLGTQLAHRLLLVMVTFMALFFLLRDGEWLGERLLAALTRGFGDPGERLTRRWSSPRGSGIRRPALCEPRRAPGSKDEEERYAVI